MVPSLFCVRGKSETFLTFPSQQGKTRLAFLQLDDNSNVVILHSSMTASFTVSQLIALFAEFAESCSEHSSAVG